MTRASSRISRLLLSVLAVIIAVGLIFYLYELRMKVKALSQREQRDQAVVPRPAVAVAAAEVAPPPPTPAATQPATLPPPAMAFTRHDPLADGKNKLEAGRLLEARQLLNDAILGGRLTDSDDDTARNLLAKINQSVIFSPTRFADDPFGGTYTVQRGDRLLRIASEHDITWEFLGRLNNLSDPRKLRIGAVLKVIHGPFHAVVNKSRFTMDIYLGPPMEKGCLFVRSFPVGLGADDSTPTGVWMVEPHKKLKNPTYFSPRGEGVIAANDPTNPLGEYWIGLTGIDGHAVGKLSYGIHGTIEPDSIGKMQSLGCIRLLNDDAAMVFEMLVEGKSTVVVRE